jgi:hypothetical protein
MRSTTPAMIDGKPYELAVNFNGQTWQVVAYGPRGKRIVVLDNVTRQHAQDKISALACERGL